jgi:hypothetical protein
MQMTGQNSGNAQQSMNRQENDGIVMTCHSNANVCKRLPNGTFSGAKWIRWIGSKRPVMAR